MMLEFIMSDTINDYWKTNGDYYKLVCLAGFESGDIVSNTVSLWIFKPLNGSLNVAFTSEFVTFNMIEVSTEEAMENTNV